MQAGAEVATFDLDVVRRFAELVVDGLASAREEIDALNVYPVPDGDTGTNMFLTVESARDAMLAALVEHPGELRVAMQAYSRGALLGARGNSGVILSQLVGALLRRIGRAGPDDRSASVFAEGMALATDAAYSAVGKPVEGTILSVARAASVAAAKAAAVQEVRLGAVVHAAASAARAALALTPEQLPMLKEAGVVDAGGRGLCVVLDSAESAITGERVTTTTPRVGTSAIPVARIPTDDLTEDGPAYEVLYLLETDDDSIPALRDDLAPLGDSLVVVGGEGLWNVHIHVDDVGAAVEAGIRAGAPRRIEVTHFAEQIERARDKRSERVGRKLVIVAAGPGLAEIFTEAGAVVLHGGPGSRPSTGQILAAIEATGAKEVIVLPNDPDSVGVAEAAAHEAEAKGVHVVVIPTQAQVQGIAALAVHEPGRPLDSDVVHMTAAARGARHGAVTVAAKDAMTTAGPCSVGDALGVVHGDFAIVGKDLYEVATGVLERLLGGGGELVTLVAGVEAGDLALACEHWVQRAHPGVDVALYEGGQERYPLLMAVE
ncbi:MAG: DAK2 domain-containing protein [Marmoricola sp.]